MKTCIDFHVTFPVDITPQHPMDCSIEFPSLSAEFLRPLISTKWLGQSLFVFDRLESTNSYALHLAENGVSHGTVVLANCQTAGKGRLGREWHSPGGINLYVSVILTQKPEQRFISWIPLATGIAVAETLEAVAKLEVELKWPNDILMNSKKVGGILCESATKGPQGWVVVVGVGLNINSREDHFPEEFRKTATSLAVQTGRCFDRHKILAIFFSWLEFYYERVVASDLPSLHRHYVSRSSTLGRPVQARLLHDEIVEGIASDIGPEGELRLIPSTTSQAQPLSSILIRTGDIFHLR